MRKVYKCALIKDQMEGTLNILKDNTIEVQLLGDDDLSLLADIKDKISSIHLPIENGQCDLSYILNSFETKNDFINTLNEIISICPGIGLVVHADLYAENVYKLEKDNPFLKWVSDNKVKIYLENVSSVKNLKKGLIAPAFISKIFNEIIGKSLFEPLLDVCHFEIARNKFSSNIRYNLLDTLILYEHQNMRIHLCSAVGCGDNSQGGIHGSNFKEDIPLLEKILKEVKPYNPYLVLEVGETDYINKPNAVWLNNKIDEIEQKKVLDKKTICKI